jgi:glucosyl-3-phosphoglycerate synthase
MGSPVRRFHHSAFSAAALAPLKADRVVSVCIPARNEERTIGAIVQAIRAEFVDQVRLVDEIVVADVGSSDSTASAALQSGAMVVPVQWPTRQGAGKGAAMAAAFAASSGDIIVFLDGDVDNFAPHFVLGLLGPLLCHTELHIVKASYARPLNGVPGEGGRVSELVAKPLLELFHPHPASFAQPLAGEVAARRFVLDGLLLPVDYGVDVALLIEVAGQLGLAAMAEVDLGERVHRNRLLLELVPQARMVIEAILTRSTGNELAGAGPTALKAPARRAAAVSFQDVRTPAGASLRNGAMAESD